MLGAEMLAKRHYRQDVINQQVRNSETAESGPCSGTNLDGNVDLGLR